MTKHGIRQRNRAHGVHCLHPTTEGTRSRLTTRHFRHRGDATRWGTTSLEQVGMHDLDHYGADAADHLERCGNLPAVDGGIRLMERMDMMMDRLIALEQTINRRFDRVERRVDGLDNKVDGLDRKVTVANKNFMARLENSIVVSGEMVLVPLYSSRTGEEIANCPSTLAELERLSPQEAADLLRELDETRAV
ncbi:hypothetical protein GQ602_004734 [Ophiocordyceps camponoti-floridani]|uniref:Uncharacterized protein n=1 Tax=Ophiocordyceps camponoti-floridani TaxID=2030778 RepID=A0A8H4Q4F7_9HYPO|nr:hypothetical protein GQ602_004734 [Ophiocordyceps camponoti-floridani]